MVTIPQPKATEQVIDNNGLMNRSWYRFFSSMQISVSGMEGVTFGALAFKDFVDFSTSEVVNKDAISVSFNPVGTDLSALNVQAAIVELSNQSNTAVNISFSDVLLLTGTNNVQDVIDFIGLSTINPGVGLNGGGTIVSSPTLNLADTAVTPGTYGDANNVAQITVDQQGRLTNATNVPIGSVPVVMSMNILNPGAEDFTGSSPDNWTDDTAVLMSITGPTGDGTLPHTGARFFYAGNTALTVAHQDVAVPSSSEGAIDAGNASLLTEFYGAGSPNDRGRIRYEFFDALMVSLGTQIPSYRTAPGGNNWTLYSDEFPIPTQTRFVRYFIDLERQTGISNDFYMDTISSSVISAGSGLSSQQIMSRISIGV